MKTAKKLLAIGLAAVMVLGIGGVAYAAIGGRLATVTLNNGSCNVAGTFDGTYYIAIKSDSCMGTTIGIYTPPAGDGVATEVSTKDIRDGSGNLVVISALAWDPSRNQLWGAYADNLWLIDIGDPTVSGDALAVHQFTAGVGGSSLVDGLAYDGSNDTLYYSPDVNLNVYHFSTAGVLLDTVTPKNVDGVADGLVSGVVVGSDNTLYIGRDGAGEIRRIDKTTGDFISQFATTSGRVEDLTCDPVTYAPLEVILAQDAYYGLYEAFEVEPGTCPLPGGLVVPVDIKPASCPNPLQTKGKGVLPVAILGTGDLDVSEIDPATVQLEGVDPLRWAMEDVATPFDGEIGDPPDREDCTTAGPDGITDLSLKFDKQEIVATMGDVDDGDVLVLTLTGKLLDGTEFSGQDVVWIVKKK